MHFQTILTLMNLTDLNWSLEAEVRDLEPLSTWNKQTPFSLLGACNVANLDYFYTQPSSS